MQIERHPQASICCFVVFSKEKWLPTHQDRLRTENVRTNQHETAPRFLYDAGLAPDYFDALRGKTTEGGGSRSSKGKGSQKLKDWVGHDGWLYKRGTGLVTFFYISPDGQEYTSEQEAEAAYEAYEEADTESRDAEESPTVSKAAAAAAAATTKGSGAKKTKRSLAAKRTAAEVDAEEDAEGGDEQDGGGGGGDSDEKSEDDATAAAAADMIGGSPQQGTIDSTFLSHLFAL
jgi:hypothetical protein